MVRGMIFLAVALACASCGAQEEQATNAAVANDAEAPKPVDQVRPGEPGGLPDDRSPVAEGPIDPDSAQGAGQVLQSYGALIEQGRYAQAYRLWSDSGRASGQSETEFVAAQRQYAEIHMEIGGPGQVEGAAGSAYVDYPVRLYGRTKDGRSFSQAGTATLRRVNDVPGSTAEQRRWHIYKIELQPRP